MQSIGQPQALSAAKIRTRAMLPARAWLLDAQVEAWCREAGHAWRSRVFDPVVTLAACVRKQLSAGFSARKVEDWLGVLAGSDQGGGDGNDFCRARARLPESVFTQAVAHVGLQAQPQAGTWRGWRVRLVDGTTLRAPRTPANVQAFGCSPSGNGASILPVVRLALVVCALSGAVVAQRMAGYFHGELRLFYELLEALAPGTLFIGDGAYSSYLVFWRVRQHGGHLLAPLDPTRRSRRSARFGVNDELHEWPRTQLAASAFPEWLRQAPKHQQVRVIVRTIRRKGYRPYVLRLCTTLLDPIAYPADELVDWYLRRWRLETQLRSIKQYLALGRLSAQTPANIRKEVLSGLLAFNLVRLAAVKSGGTVECIGFERPRELLLETCAHMAAAPTVQLPELQRRMLRLIAQTGALPRTRAPEPRAILQNRSCYPTLRISRSTWRKQHLAA